jgi:hypothetical protein
MTKINFDKYADNQIDKMLNKANRELNIFSLLVREKIKRNEIFISNLEKKLKLIRPLNNKT